MPAMCIDTRATIWRLQQPHERQPNYVRRTVAPVVCPPCPCPTFIYSDHGCESESAVSKTVALHTTRNLSDIFSRTLIVRMISTAQTGYFYTTKRLRLGPTLAAVKYDPVGQCVVCLLLYYHPGSFQRSEATSVVC